ncbi:tRNA (guanosine(46)-N7)-methyltransferase TrmB [Rhodobium gokarnense]|uniref:tRNA (guanine-N(7)-)-methyltransferase n=1 Tax=Rhodobium gokarnense TaxID=364296 RepID=A0ABT3HID2_9HYPH|nr:tRNA (guanosine(46)-N7)-methyltransferase TrmB [Rhodobium gokarnense]MCW2310094.1 tRNA (guanine-N7-)-methyltransferase [Rhodobium gokarnense]
MTGERRAGTLYGRRKGKKLGARRTGLMAGLLPRLALDLTTPAPDRPALLFPGAAVRALWMEIGFGGGEHLVARAGANPDIGIIGCEPFVNGMAKAVSAVDATGLANIRLHEGDAGDVLDWLPDAALQRVFLLYPDPWPKRRHWKRRFVSRENLDRIARVLRPGGELLVASDIESYVAWTLAHIRDHPSFAWTARRADDWRRPFADWPGTRYEAKAIREGRVPTYLRFRRTDAAPLAG